MTFATGTVLAPLPKHEAPKTGELPERVRVEGRSQTKESFAELVTVADTLRSFCGIGEARRLMECRQRGRAGNCRDSLLPVVLVGSSPREVHQTRCEFGCAQKYWKFPWSWIKLRTMNEAGTRDNRADGPPRIVFIHGRPAAHPLHSFLARSVHADFLPVDFLLRWHDRDCSRLRRYLSWFLCAFFFPQRSKYDVFISEGPHFLPAMMKRLGLLAKGQSIAALMDNESMYFLKAARYPASTCAALRKATLSYDALICVGSFQHSLARELTQHAQTPPKLFVVPSAPSEDRKSRLLRIRPRLGTCNLVFIGAGPAEWRGWYKGLDLLIAAVALASARIDQLRLRVVGEWDQRYLDSILGNHPDLRSNIEFLGHRQDIESILEDAALYVHLGRGEAFGIAILEALCAGVPAVVSEWTGAKEAASQVDPRLVVPLDAKAAADCICWFMNLSLEEKSNYSARAREIARTYTEAAAAAKFVEIVNQIATNRVAREARFGVR